MQVIIFVALCGLTLGFMGMSVDVVFSEGRGGIAETLGDYGARLALVSLFTVMLTGLWAMFSHLFLK